MEEDFLVDQTYSIYYPELEHDWEQANQVVNISTGRVSERRFNLLEFDSDFKVQYVNTPPEPEPYYTSSEEKATAYFNVTRTCHSKVYLGADEFEIGGQIYSSAADFKRWGFLETTFIYERKYLDVETGSVVWRNKPAIPGTVDEPAQTFDEYQLIIDGSLVRTQKEDLITLAIPQGIWGISTPHPGVYFVDSPEDTTSVDRPVPSLTSIITAPYVQIRKTHLTKTPFRLSLRGRTTVYLPGTFIPQSIKELKFLNHSDLKPRRDRLTPPNTAIAFSFPDLTTAPAIEPKNTSNTGWEVI